MVRMRIIAACFSTLCAGSILSEVIDTVHSTSSVETADEAIQVSAEFVGVAGSRMSESQANVLVSKIASVNHLLPEFLTKTHGDEPAWQIVFKNVNPLSMPDSTKAERVGDEPIQTRDFEVLVGAQTGKVLQVRSVLPNIAGLELPLDSWPRNRGYELERWLAVFSFSDKAPKEDLMQSLLQPKWSKLVNFANVKEFEAYCIDFQRSDTLPPLGLLPDPGVPFWYAVLLTYDVDSSSPSVGVRVINGKERHLVIVPGSDDLGLVADHKTKVP